MLNFIPPGQTGVALTGLNQEIWTEILGKQLELRERPHFLTNNPIEIPFVTGQPRGRKN